MAQMPKGLPAKLQKLPIKQLIARDLSAYERRSATTINKTLTLLGAVLARAEQDGHYEILHYYELCKRGLRTALRQAAICLVSAVHCHGMSSPMRLLGQPSAILRVTSAM